MGYALTHNLFHKEDQRYQAGMCPSRQRAVSEVQCREISLPFSSQEEKMPIQVFPSVQILRNYFQAASSANSKAPQPHVSG